MKLKNFWVRILASSFLIAGISACSSSPLTVSNKGKTEVNKVESGAVDSKGETKVNDVHTGNVEAQGKNDVSNVDVHGVNNNGATNVNGPINVGLTDDREYYTFRVIKPDSNLCSDLSKCFCQGKDESGDLFSSLIDLISGKTASNESGFNVIAIKKDKSELACYIKKKGILSELGALLGGKKDVTLSINLFDASLQQKFDLQAIGSYNQKDLDELRKNW